MKSGIATKLFLVLVGISIVVIVAVGVSARISFARGFLGYLNGQGVASMESLAPRVAAAYQEHGDWEFLRRNTRAWFDMLRPGPPNSTDPEMRSMPAIADLDFTGIHLRLTLLDKSKRYVVGNPTVSSATPMRAVTVAGETVGWLALVPFQQATAKADVRFQRRQLTANWVIAVSTVTLAALAAWWLSRLLVTPLRRITGATRQLASGDYSVRIPVTSQDELGRLSEDFNSLAQALAKNELLRRSFMADVSHELRTPLAVLQGELEAIEDGIRRMTPETLASLQLEVATLGKLVNDLYDLSLSDVGALSYRMVELDIGELLQVTLAAFQQRFSQRGLEVDAQIGSPDPLVYGDEGRLRQLFNNLFENSARYIDTGGTMRIECRCANSDVLIELEDSGPGVTSDILPHLFERFVRADASRSRATGGAGLGLAICRNIVEAHGGTITATSAPLGGLLISIRLPRVVATQLQS